MRTAIVVLVLVLASGACSQEFNTWQKLDSAVIHGRRYEMPLVHATHMKRFLVVGGRTSYAEYRKIPRSYDEIALDPAKNQWENLFPEGKDWGPRFGECKAPAWKGEYWEFKDLEGNIRPNWTVYGTFSIARQYDYDPDTRTVVFFAQGKTFQYDPTRRTWKDLKPAADPQSALGGILLWSSMCYDRHNKRFVLFGGGNVQSKSGAPGTWAYFPAENTWKQIKTDAEPPPRANAPMVYDPVAKKIVLFGGDQLDQLLGDTWVFDVTKQQWEERKPARGPSPRAGHALLWLPKARKVLLVGGYEYTSATGYVESLYRPLATDVWVYDTAANTWDLVTRAESTKTGPVSPRNMCLSAAANEEDLVVLVANGTWTCQIDVTRPDAAGTARHGVKPGSVLRRTGPHDPAWLAEGVPAADPAKVADELKSLPVNQWAVRPTPKLPRPNMDWGSAVFSPELDLIMRFSGGHSAYSGTAPQVYDVKTDRYSIPFAPEYPIEYVYSNDQVRGEWSFKGNPWMTGHTYKATGYDPRLRCLVFAAHEYTYFFDPKQGKWSRNGERNPFVPNMYVVTLCSTPKGVVAWANRRDKGAGFWRLDAATRTWKPLPHKGPLPATSADRHGMAYDSKRDRLLLLSAVDKNKGDVLEYDLKTGESKWLHAAGKEHAGVSGRETVYLAEADMIMVGAHVAGPDKKRLWPVYDCTKNAWFGVELPGADPVGKGDAQSSFNNSVGLMYDPNRHLVWAVGQNSHVHVLPFDRKRARLMPLGN